MAYTFLFEKLNALGKVQFKQLNN